jgi:uncharacterized protein involved in exopolysaccharide biosynthesis
MNSTLSSDRVATLSVAASLAFLWKRRLWLVLGAALGFAGGLAFGVVADKEYVGQTVVMAAERSNLGKGIGGVAGQLAGLVGLSVPGGSNKVAALGTLESRGLCLRFANQVDLVEKIFHATESHGLLRKVLGLGPRKYTADDACTVLKEKHLGIESNELTGIISISVRWSDPVTASEWANAFVTLANQNLQERAISEAEGTLAATREQLKVPHPMEIEIALSRVVEQQLADLAVARGTPQFALTVLDPAVPKEIENHDWPRLKTLVLLGAFFGCLGAVLLALVLNALADARRARDMAAGG